MGFGELLVILIILLLLFGAGRLASVGEGLGKAVRAFKEAMRSVPPAPPPPPARGKDLPPPGGSEE